MRAFHPKFVSLVVVGSSGAGKSTVAAELNRVTGVPIIEIGNIVRDDAQDHGVTPLERAQEAFLSEGNDVFAKRAVDLSLKLGKPCIIVGPRMESELIYIKKRVRPSVSIALTIEDGPRRARVVKRSGDPFGSFDEHRDIIERGWGLEKTINSCDVKIDSDRDLSVVVEEFLSCWEVSDLKESK